MPLRHLLRLAAHTAAVGAVVTATLATTPASPAHADGTTPSYVETGPGDDPVSAAPDVTRPDTPHCTVTLADHFLSNAPDGSPQYYSGTFRPPAACPGPWAKVVLDSTSSVSGRQYDRSGSLQLGGATIWFGTTAEPGGATPTTFSFAKDVTRYSALFRQEQPYRGGVENYMSSIYTGNYDQSVSLTFYEADKAHPAPVVPDRVVGVPVPDLTPGQRSAQVALPSLPRNITGADLEVTLKGNGCDEQWFTAVPDGVASAIPGVCAGGPYREATVGVDGTPAGALGTYPHIYSGGIVPTLWRPVLAIDTLDLRPEHLDLTPFAGRLVDGGQHTLDVAIPRINDRWNVVATLFLTTDHHRARTSGALVRADVAPAVVDESNHATGNGDEQAYAATARRSDVVTGYVDTSAGRVWTTVRYDRDYRQDGTISGGGWVQSIDQTDHVAQSSVSRLGPAGPVVRRWSVDETYPISVAFSGSWADDQNYSLQATVDMGQQVASALTSGDATVARGWDWTVDSWGEQARSAGVISAKDGHSTTSYVGTDDAGAHHDRTITTEHGLVTSTTGS
jgi:hypothetical protein